MKKLTFLTLMALASAHGAMAQTQADSLRADSIFKSLELQGVEVVKQKPSRIPLSICCVKYRW